MARYLFFCFLLQYSLLSFGQNIKMISIEVGNARPMNLSEIAKEVVPIVLEEPSGGIQNVLLTDEYLFVATAGYYIVQYDLSGKFIRAINCGGAILNNVASDITKKELYVPVHDKIKCFDYSGNLKKEYSLKTDAIHCFYHKDILWVPSIAFQPDNSVDYKINRIDLLTGKVTTLPFEKKDCPKTEDGRMIPISAASRLTLYNDEVIASFEFDSVIYKIQHNKVIPFIQWNISPRAQSNADRSPRASGFIGYYLFIHYRRNHQFYTFFENMKTGKKNNASEVIDDIFHTSGDCRILPLNKTGCFCFIKDKSEMKGNSIRNIPLKNGPVVFIVKTK